MKKTVCLSLATIFFISGCAVKEKEVFKNQEAKKFFKKVDKDNVFIPNYKKANVTKYISMSDGLTIKEAIEKLNDIYGTSYYYSGENIILPKSNFKVYTPQDLAYYVKETTDYILKISPVYLKNRIVKVYLEPKTKSKKYHYMVAGESKLLDELFKVSNSGIKVIVSNDVYNKPIKLAINTTDVNDFIKAVCDAGDVWCNLTGDRTLYVRATKELTVSIDKDGAMNFGLGNTTSGADSGSGNDTNSTSEGGDNGGNMSAESGGEGIGYSVSSENYKTLVKQFADLFDVDAYPGKNGYIVFNVTPSQYRKIRNYFNERDKRKELIKAQISIYRVDLKDEFKYGINWSSINKFIFKGINGLTINQNYKMLDPLTNNGGFLEFRDKALRKEIEDYIAKNKNNLTVDDIQKLRNLENGGIVQLLETFGKVYQVDSFSNQFYTGEYMPFGNYETIRYITVGSTGGDNPEPTTEVNSVNVGFQGSLEVNKKDDGYDINGIINQSAITNFTTLNSKYGEIKVPNTTQKILRIKTHLSSLNRTIILGGFITKGIDNQKQFTPGVGNIPMFGYLFKNKDNLSKNSEFIIVLKIRKSEEGK
jgi:type II secretory pathway component GspD/PulD (secretin)